MPKPKFFVRVKEVHHQMYEVNDAETAMQARDIVQGGGGMISGDSEYAHTLGEEEWEVYDKDQNEVKV